MKLLCFSIFAVIANVLTNDKAHYKWDVAVTNVLAEYAYGIDVIKENKFANGLEHVIKTIVINNNYDIETLNRMIVMPDCPYCYDKEDSYKLPESKNLQLILQNKIKTELNIDYRGAPNSLEFKNLTFGTLGDERRLHTQIALRNIISQAIGGERKNIGERSKLLKKYNVWVSPSNYDPKGKSELIEDDDYEHVADESVTSSFERLKIIDNYVRKDGGKPSIKNLNSPLNWTCQFIALFLSTTCPMPDLEAWHDDRENSCTVKINTNKPRTYVYRQTDGKWCRELQNLIA